MGTIRDRGIKKWQPAYAVESCLYLRNQTNARIPFSITRILEMFVE